jgi:hypothetical protein
LGVHERWGSQARRSAEFALNGEAKSREEPMCPACIASAALIITGIMSTGGLTALAAKKLHAKQHANDGSSFDSKSHTDVKTKSDTHGKEGL